MKTRPYRIYKRKGEHKRFVRKDGKKTYIRMKNMAKMTDKHLVNVMIKNVVGHRRVPVRTTTTTPSARSKAEGIKPLAYTQGIAPKLVHVPLTPFLTDDKEEIKKLKENAKDHKVVVNVEKQGKKEHEPKVIMKDGDTEMSQNDSQYWTKTARKANKDDERNIRVSNSIGGKKIDQEKTHEMVLFGMKIILRIAHLQV